MANGSLAWTEPSRAGDGESQGSVSGCGGRGGQTSSWVGQDRDQTDGVGWEWERGFGMSL